MNSSVLRVVLIGSLSFVSLIRERGNEKACKSQNLQAFVGLKPMLSG
jgi:hypothetical protein